MPKFNDRILLEPKLINLKSIFSRKKEMSPNEALLTFFRKEERARGRVNIEFYIIKQPND